MTQDPRRLGLRTRAVHAGEAPDPTTRASAPNIVMSTTFVVDDADAQFSANALVDDAPFLYTRWANPTVRQLERKLADLEGGEAAVAFASGMAATTALLLHVLKAGDHLIVSEVTYAGVAELVRDTLPRLGIEVEPVDLSDLEALGRALRAETRLVYAETPSNPILKLTDIEAVARLTHEAGARLVVDSTFATPVATRPLERGADFAVHSLTKYIGGHGDAVGGAVVGGADALAALTQDTAIHVGGVLSPFNAWLIMRGLATLPLRMKAHAESALAIARFLEARQGITRVTYPGLPSHPQHELGRRQMECFSGMLTFQVPDGRAAAHRLAERLRVIHYAVSLGHHRSLVFYLPTDEMNKNSFRLDPGPLARYRELAGEGIFRLSVGLEDTEDLCADLDQALG